MTGCAAAQQIGINAAATHRAIARRASKQVLKAPDLEAFCYYPPNPDPQVPHDHGEVYVVAAGQGESVRLNTRVNFSLGDLLFTASLWGAVTFTEAAIGRDHPIGHAVTIGNLAWDAHEITIGQVKTYAQASGFVSHAERAGGGMVYESGWKQKPGWHWRSPYGVPARDDEPAVHLDFDEAKAICRHSGRRLPTDSEWTSAAYLEQRATPSMGLVRGQRYPYPQGASAKQSHCLGACGPWGGVAPEGSLTRGAGHVPVMTTPPGVNGLYDMGGNVWEWVDGGHGDARITRGGSWWYGPERQMAEDVATKPRDARVVYIGFRCVKPL